MGHAVNFGFRIADFGLKWSHQNREQGAGRAGPWESLRNAMIAARLDTPRVFSIDSHCIHTGKTVNLAEGRDLEKAPAKDGGSWPSFAGVFCIWQEKILGSIG